MSRPAPENQMTWDETVEAAKSLAKLYGHGALNFGPSMGGLASAVKSAPAGYAKGGLAGAMDTAGRAYEAFPGVKETEGPMEIAREEAVAAGVPRWATYGVDILTPGPGEVVAAAKAVKAAILAGKIGSGSIASLSPAVLKKMKPEDLDPHGYQTTKLDDVLEDVEIEREVVNPLPPRKIVSPEELEGDVLIPIAGDRSDVGSNVLSVDGVPLERPVYLEGGGRFGELNEYPWASGSGVVTNITNKVDELAALYPESRILGVTSLMAPPAVDFSTMPTDIFAAMLPNLKVTKKMGDQFDARLRELRGLGTVPPAIAEKLLAELGTLKVRGSAFPDFLRTASPNIRKTLFQGTLDNAAILKAGFPHPAKIRKAVTDPSILGAPTKSVGMSIMELTPGSKGVRSGLGVGGPLQGTHKSYDTMLPGKHIGGLEELPLTKDIFRTYGVDNMGRWTGKLRGNHTWDEAFNRSMHGLPSAFKGQKITPEDVDRMMQLQAWAVK